MPVYLNSTNGHYYEFIATGVEYSIALAQAATRSQNGLYGYLLVIDDAQESAFVSTLPGSVGSNKSTWLGIIDVSKEGTWIIQAGPDLGKQVVYFNWRAGEPNNLGDEDNAELTWETNLNAQWGDRRGTVAGYSGIPGYVVEYGGLLATYLIVPSASTVNEGQSVTFTINTKNVLWGSAIAYTLSGISQSDLVSGSLSGTAIVQAEGQDGRATVTVSLVVDSTTEGTESLSFTVGGVSRAVSVLDTSTTDTAPPIVAAFSPTDEARGVALGANIVVTFSEPIQRGTGQIVLKTAAGATVATYDAATSTNLSISGNTLTLNPSADLSFMTGYSVVLGAGTVKDLAGNNYAGTSTYNFSTQVDPNTPALTPSSLTNYATQVYWGVNQHVYEFVPAPSGISWTDALAAASKKSLGGVQGHLVTISSAAEDQFVFGAFGGLVRPADSILLGGSDQDNEGVWKWMAGPEVGLTFSYTNWGGAEPNDTGSGAPQDWLAYFPRAYNLNGKWADAWITANPGNGELHGGYIVEYSGLTQAQAARTWPGDGRVVLPLESGMVNAPGALKYLPNGKVVLAGVQNTKFVVQQLNSDGSPDVGFGQAGRVDIATGAAYIGGGAVAYQADGKLLVVGSGDTSKLNWFDRVIVTRLNADGSLDTSYGSTGQLILPVAERDVAFDVIVQADGKAVVAGHSYRSGGYDFTALRLNADGTLDTTFGAAGKVVLDLGSAEDYGFTVNQQPDGKLVLCGHVKVGGAWQYAVVRLNTNGSTDTSFGSAGKVLLDVGAGDDQAYRVVTQPDGKLLVAGTSGNGTGSDFCVVRLNANGTLDTSFGSAGKVFVPVGYGSDPGSGTDKCFSLELMADGRIVVGGYSLWGGHGGAIGRQDLSVVRLLSTGAVDTSFGSGGKVIIAGRQVDGGMVSLDVQPDGRVLIAGQGQPSQGDPRASLNIVRLNMDGTLDTSFENAEPSLNSLNGHYYQFVPTGAGAPEAALAQAQAYSYRGLQGYLVTISSVQENDFLSGLLRYSTSKFNVVLSGTDRQIDGQWLYQSGPEQGSLMTYLPWGPGEPNGYYGGYKEDYLITGSPDAAGPLLWADAANQLWDGLTGFVVEFGGVPATYGITPSATNVNEGTSVTFTIDTTNVEWGTALSYTLSGIDQADLASGALTGTAAVEQRGQDGRAVVTVQLAADGKTEGTETLKLTVGGASTSTSVIDSSKASDTTPPTVTTFSPADEATGVAVGANIVLSFSEPIQRGTGQIVLKTAAGATVATYDAATSTNLSISGSTLTLNPAADLTPGTGYQVAFGSDSVRDLEGNSYAGTTSYNFTAGLVTYDLVASGATVNEGAAATFTVTTANVSAGTTLNYTISGLSPTDFVPQEARSAQRFFSGTTVVGTDGKASINILTLADQTTEGNETLSVSLQGKTASMVVVDTSVRAEPAYLAATQHYYQYFGGYTDWSTALSQAGMQSYRGLKGYLVTITSQLENDLVAGLAPQWSLWIGASDRDSEGVWKWMAGPESGRQFWQGAGSGSAVGGNYSNWYGPFLDNWAGGDPVGADFAVIAGNLQSNTFNLPAVYDSRWGDTTTGDLAVNGFAVEYGGLPAGYTITPSSTSVQEGNAVTFTIDTTNVEWGSSIAYTVGGITQADLASGSLTGMTVVQPQSADGRATVTLQLAADSVTEGNETLTLTVGVASASVTVVDRTVKTVFLGGAGTDLIRSVVAAPNGGLIVSGESNGSFFGFPNQGGYDGFVTRLDENGNSIWNTLISGSNEDLVDSVFRSSSGDIYAAGRTKSSIGGNINGATIYDGFITKINENGVVVWSKLLGARFYGGIYGLSEDLVGNIYYSGQFADSINNSRGLIGKITPSGNIIWNSTYSSQNQDVVLYALDLDQTGSFAYVGGYTKGALESQISFGSLDLLFSKIDTRTNSKIWTKVIGSSNYESISDVRVAPDGNIYVAGKVNGTLSDQAYLGGLFNTFLAKFDPNGNQIWLRMIAPSLESGRGMQVDQVGKVYISGSSSYMGSDITGAGGNDAFVIVVDSSGNILSKDLFGTSQDDSSKSLVIDSSGKIVIAGTSSGSPVGSIGFGTTDGVVFRTGISTAGPLGATYSISAGVSSVDEGSIAIFNVTTTRVAAGTALPYTISGLSAADIVGGVLSGATVVDASGMATVSVQLAADKLTEGAETLTLTVGGTSASVTVVDTSIKTDNTPPAVTAFSPAASATNVAVGVNIVLSFSEPIQRGIGSVVIKTGAGATVAVWDATSSANLSISGNTLIIDPSTDLAAGTAYQVTMPSGAVQDLAGNAYAGTSSYSFTTAVADTTAPTVRFADNVPGVAGSTSNLTYILTFSEPVTGLDPSDFTVINGSLGSVAGSGTAWTVGVTPAAGLASGTLTLTLKADAVTDASGNPNAQAADTSQTLDTLAPTARSFSPADGASQVAVDKPPAISVSFSESVRLAGTISLKNPNTGAVVQSFKSGDAGVTVSGDTITFTPQRLDTMAGQVLEFGAGAVTDLAGNACSPVQAYDFSTASANGLYHFFLVAFAAAPGKIYLGQLAEAWNAGLDLQRIVEIFTTKSQFTTVYPTTMSNRDLASLLVENIVRGSASAATKQSAVDDIVGALGIGWSRGKMLHTVFGNLASKPVIDPIWGGTAQQFQNQLAVARYFSETDPQGATDDLATLRAVAAAVDRTSDVSSPQKIAQLIGVALAPPDNPGGPGDGGGGGGGGGG